MKFFNAPKPQSQQFTVVKRRYGRHIPEQQQRAIQNAAQQIEDDDDEGMQFSPLMMAGRLGNGAENKRDIKGFNLSQGISQGVSAVNTTRQNYFLNTQGTADGHLWTLNMSTIPGQKKRLLTISAATTFLVNYAYQAFPSSLNLVVNQITPSTDKMGNPSHVIAKLVPKGPAVAVMNPGNIIGYNISYALMGAPDSIDITGIPVLTFDTTVNQEATPVAYPILEPIVIGLSITHVVL